MHIQYILIIFILFFSCSIDESNTNPISNDIEPNPNIVPSLSKVVVKLSKVAEFLVSNPILCFLVITIDDPLAGGSINVIVVDLRLLLLAVIVIWSVVLLVESAVCSVPVWYIIS